MVVGSKTKSVRTAEMSWREVESAIKRQAAVLVPMASTEEHGPHPTGDFVITDAVAERVAKVTDDVITPTIPFAYSEYFRHFPGTVTLQPETFRLLVYDIVSGLLDHGFRHIVLLNGHGGNEPLLQLLARQIRRERGVLVPHVNATSFGLTSTLLRELYGDEPTGHGAESTGSEYSYLRPDLIDLDAVDRVEEWGSKPFCGLPATSNGVEFNGQQVGMALNMEDVCASSGSSADPRGVSVAKGQRIVENAVKDVVAFVEWFKTVDPTAKP